MSSAAPTHWPSMSICMNMSFSEQVEGSDSSPSHPSTAHRMEGKCRCGQEAVCEEGWRGAPELTHPGGEGQIALSDPCPRPASASPPTRGFPNAPRSDRFQPPLSSCPPWLGAAARTATLPDPDRFPIIPIPADIDARRGEFILNPETSLSLSHPDDPDLRGAGGPVGVEPAGALRIPASDPGFAGRREDRT